MLFNNSNKAKFFQQILVKQALENYMLASNILCMT